jgi:hypothetical protein
VTERPWRIKFAISGEIEIYPPTTDVAAPGGVITFTTEKGSSIMGEITVDATEATLRATVSFTDAEGNPTVPDTEPVWAVADESVLTCTPAADGLSATFVVGNPGVSSVTVSTTETHGGEGTPTDVILTGLVTVVSGDTVAGSVDFAVG